MGITLYRAMAVGPIRDPTALVAPTTVAELVRVCDGANFNQLLRERKICHADETAGRPVLSYVFLEQPDDQLRMFLERLSNRSPHKRGSTS